MYFSFSFMFSLNLTIENKFDIQSYKIMKYKLVYDSYYNKHNPNKHVIKISIILCMIIV